MANSSKRDARALAALERDQKCCDMRLSGQSWEAIAEALGYGSRGNAYRAWKRRMDARRKDCSETAEEVRELEIERLDRMLKAALVKAEAGDLQAVGAVLKIQDRRTAYMGLDTPKALTVELNRNLEAMLGRARAVLNDEQFELLLAALGGDHRPPDVGGAKGAEEPGEAEGGEEPG